MHCIHRKGDHPSENKFFIIHLREECVKQKITDVCCHCKFVWRLFLRNVKKTICIENGALKKPPSIFQ